MIKNLLEYLLISLLQKLLKILNPLGAILKIHIKIPIQLHIIKQMRGKQDIRLLDKLDHLLDTPLILIVCIDMVNQIIE